MENSKHAQLAHLLAETNLIQKSLKNLFQNISVIIIAPNNFIYTGLPTKDLKRPNNLKIQ